MPRMPPGTKHGGSASKAEDVGKLLLRLKLKVAALHSGGASAVRECLKAAQILEASVDTLERGASALTLALSQGSAAEAKKSIDKAKYLSIEATSLLRPFLKTQGMSEETRWRLLRPVMRLLLWLIPEHLPTPWTVSAAAVTVQPAGQGTAAGRQNTAATEADEGWRQVTAITFACEVTTAALAKVVLDMADWLVCKDGSISDSSWHRAIKGAWILEECLIWLTLIARLQNIASALTYAERAEALPTSSRLDVEHVPLAEYLLSELPKQAYLLDLLGMPVWFWIDGHLQPNTSLPEQGLLRQKAVSSPERQAFAASFEPSHELANATGLWRPPAGILQRVALLSTLPVHGLSSAPLSGEACLYSCKRHGRALSLLLPGECLPSQGDELQDYVRRLPSLVHLHLRGLALMYRLGLKCSCLVEMGKASPLVAAAHRCICKTIAPMLIQDPALLRGAVRYLPQGMVSAGDSSPALIAVYRKCDSTLDIVQQQQLTQQQQQQQGGEGPGGPVVDQPGERSRQEVTDLGSAVLQHIMESSQHREQMLQQESGAARQVLLQTEDMLDQDGDMVDCAVAAGELLRLAFQALDVHPDLGDREVGIVRIAEALLFLLQLLRPTAYSASTLSSRQGRAWVLCLSNIAHRLDVLLGEEEAEQPSSLWKAIGLRVLLEQIMPALQHAAGCDHSSTLDRWPADSEDSATKSDQEPSPHGYSTLLLLGAAAHVLHVCLPAASISPDAYMILSDGLQHASSTQQGQPGEITALVDGGSDDLETAVHAAQTLAAELVSGGAWWQEAKAHYPLLLIDTLDVLIQALPMALPDSGDTAGSWTWPCARCAAQRHDGGAAEGNASSRPGSCPVPHPQDEVVKQGVSSQHAADSTMPPQGGADGTATQALNQGDGQPYGSHPCSSGSGSSGHHTLGFSTCRGSLDTTGLMFALVARLWALLSDKDVVGEAPRPAAWMQESAWYASQSVKVLVGVLKALDSKVKDVIDQLVAPGTAVHNQPEGSSSSSSSSSDAQAGREGACRPGMSSAGQHVRVERAYLSTVRGSRVSPDDTAQLALQLASMMPHVSMEDVESGAEGSPGWGNADFIAAMSKLRGQLGVEPALRVVCMLALTGHLDQQQREVVIALLGGRGSSSSDYSTTSELRHDSAACSDRCLPIPEPLELAAARQEHNITLQDLAICVLAPPGAAHLVGMGLQEESFTPAADHVLLAFGADQLPCLALAHGADPRLAQPGSSRQKHEQQLDSAPALPDSDQEEEERVVAVWQRQELEVRAHRASELLGTKLMAQYQSWLRSSLLKVDCDVLTEHARPGN